MGAMSLIILPPDTSREEGYAMMERVRQKILDLEWDRDLAISISGGVIEVKCDESADLLRKVDQLLYRAKNKSKI